MLLNYTFQNQIQRLCNRAHIDIEIFQQIRLDLVHTKTRLHSQQQDLQLSDCTKFIVYLQSCIPYIMLSIPLFIEHVSL